MEKKLKSWQGWLLFCGAMAVVFVLGLVVSSLMERRAETVSVFNNKRVEITGIEARNEVFGENYPRQYETWKETAKTDFKSEFNGNEAVDVLEQRPEMVVLWGGWLFRKYWLSTATRLTFRCLIFRQRKKHRNTSVWIWRRSVRRKTK